MPQQKKILFIDLETTGTNCEHHGIHQIGAIMDIDGKEAAAFSKNVKPHTGAKVDPQALAVSGTSWPMIKDYPTMPYVFEEFVQMISMFADPAGQERIYIAGYNSQALEGPFLREWYKQNGAAQLFGSHFHSSTLDIMTLCAKHYMEKGISPVSYSLQNMARITGVVYEAGKLHNALYDAQLARKLYYKLEILNKL